MNLLHMQYAVEVAKTNSINRAAEKLFVGQSALSRAIKELESNLGVTLFERSAKGMFLTPDGEVFLRYASKILKQVGEMETVLSDGAAGKKRFSLFAPRTEYAAEAFAIFSRFPACAEEAELVYREADTTETIRGVLHEEAQFGILRYASHYDAYFKTMLEEKGLEYELIAEFRNVLVMSRESLLAKSDSVSRADLSGYWEIVYADPVIPSLPIQTVQKDALQEEIGEKRILLFERSAQFTLLHQNPKTFLWTAPLSKEKLARFDLVQRCCQDAERSFCDLLIRRRGQRLSTLDCDFLDALMQAKRAAFGPENE